MGGGGSKPAQAAPRKTVIEDTPPAGSDQSSIIYDFVAGPRLDGISRSLANDCPGCTLRIVSGLSGSSVKITRQYGTANLRQCGSYQRDLQMTKEKKMSWIDFMNNLEGGNYMRDLGNGYCEEIGISPEEAMKVKNGGEYKENVLKTVRIRKQGF